jgi:hypothetical protein
MDVPDANTKIPSAQKTFMRKLPATTAYKSTQYPGRLVNRDNHGHSQLPIHAGCPFSEHFEQLKSHSLCRRLVDDVLCMLLRN